MVRSDPRSFRTKRQILYSDRVDDEERNACADLLLEEERYGEALEFLERTRDAGRLERVLAAGLERGDSFLLSRVEKIRGEEIPADLWRRAAERALELGRVHDAFRALEEAGEEERAEELRAAQLPDFHPFRPEGK